MTLHDLVLWSSETSLAIALRDSRNAFPAIVSIHLLGLAVLGGMTIAVDLRLLGLGLRSRTAADLWRDVRVWALGALAVTTVTGVLLFLSEALRCYETPPFWIKIGAFVVAVVFTCTWRARVLRTATTPVPRVRDRVTGVVSLTLWFIVALMGRVVGFW